ncbi:MAG: hypothetical protein EI684_17360 [Candidatus Viridilinea halotolerans]|uniref:Uncharacterized protein n=1 Tax=Candidatus Viridilinea halotolerans TaxID=2491704 RepID=A0A426TUA4_9CHLR|nr:MAG: hypothetical protein EI684_17360 [Candidatus Viridilinea halotolerans]
MAPLFPAIIVNSAAPADGQRRVYQMSQYLCASNIAHYVLWADQLGVAGWSDQTLPEAPLRPPTALVPHQVAALAQAIQKRHLPLLVDVSNLDPAGAEEIAARCTHALLSATDSPTDQPWLELSRLHGLVLLRDSKKDGFGRGEALPENPHPTLKFQEEYLENYSINASADYYYKQLVQLCQYSAEECYRAHVTRTAIDLVLHLERAIYPLPAHPNGTWSATELPQLLQSLPSGEALAIYGRAPNWLYAALASFSAPAPCMIFDACYGWVAPLPLHQSSNPTSGPLAGQWLHHTKEYKRLRLATDHIPPSALAGQSIPNAPAGEGLILDGQLPAWLWVALVRAYQPSAAWLAIHRHETDDAIIVYTTNQERYRVGTTIRNA